MGKESALNGRTLAGRYRITGLLGQGGMATVYRGSHEGDPPEVAIKILNPSFAKDEKFVRRFEREAKSAARLKHRSTVRIFDYGVEDGLPYIVMELIQGAELLHVLHHERRMPEARAARIVAQVCSALAAAHEHGIVHRDLKPENIMLLRDPKDPTVERVKVLDFGIAKIMEPDLLPPDAPPPSSDQEPPSFGRTMLTMIGTIVGTPEYMSPEQTKGETLDARSDVYSVGVLLYYLVTGRLPFIGDTPFATAMLHVTDEPRPPSAYMPTMNKRFEALILRAMAKSRDERPQSARELQELLLEILPELAAIRHMSVPAPAARAQAAAAAGGDAGAASTAVGGAPNEPSFVVQGLGSSPDGLDSRSAATLVALTAPGAIDASAETSPGRSVDVDAVDGSAFPMTPPRRRLSDGVALLIGVALGALIVAATALFLLMKR